MLSDAPMALRALAWSGWIQATHVMTALFGDDNEPWDAESE
ncbi:hypothetical protein [Thiocapsa rosea]|uniref:Uncharacterized protein n=1 Tax=Thiocapsa rosea TaxID=69360 RepID=A0A495VD19_9GAMM|nr:hypothetical protein [Thiocapsa rosea]RKT46267.1 hypothetical protein BDD21_3773 [Thiocapsa rosea]